MLQVGTAAQRSGSPLTFFPLKIPPVPNPYNRTTERSSKTFRLSTK
jgi:hypothetical protein